jgi:hypothetical protein
MRTPNTRTARWLAWSLFALAVALGLGTLPLAVAVTASGTPLPLATMTQLQLTWRPWEGILGRTMITWVFTALGALLVARFPTRTLGWLFCALGVTLVADSFAGSYAVYALVVVPGALPGGLVAGCIQQSSWLVEIALLFMFVPLRFPTGRLVSPRWRPIWWLAVGATAALVLSVTFQPVTLGNYLEGFNIPNPLGTAGLGDVADVLIGVPYAVYLSSILLSGASLVVRLRRARGLERQQIKWFVYCVILLLLIFVAQAIVHDALNSSVPRLDSVLSLGTSLIGFGLVVSLGLSVLRYRLFDIDVIIRRTLIYGTLTALLAGIYVGLVIAAQAVIRALTGQTGQQPPVIVASTLLVAALARPLRQGIQTAIDRRFYRSKVDAKRTLATFGDAMRSVVDLSDLSQRLLTVAQETMQPAHVSLWLRPSVLPDSSPGTVLSPRGGDA